MHGSAAHAARVARAIKASGAVVRVAAVDFLTLLRRADAPLVVVARGGLFRKEFRYLSAYKGLVFLATSADELVLPPRCEVVAADRIWLPD